MCFCKLIYGSQYTRHSVLSGLLIVLVTYIAIMLNFFLFGPLDLSDYWQKCVIISNGNCEFVFSSFLLCPFLFYVFRCFVVKGSHIYTYWIFLVTWLFYYYKMFLFISISTFCLTFSLVNIATFLLGVLHGIFFPILLVSNVLYSCIS